MKPPSTKPSAVHGLTSNSQRQILTIILEQLVAVRIQVIRFWHTFLADRVQHGMFIHRIAALDTIALTHPSPASPQRP